MARLGKPCQQELLLASSPEHVRTYGVEFSSAWCRCQNSTETPHAKMAAEANSRGMIRRTGYFVTQTNVLASAT